MRWAEAWNIAKHPTIHSTALHNKELSSLIHQCSHGWGTQFRKGLSEHFSSPSSLNLLENRIGRQRQPIIFSSHPSHLGSWDKHTGKLFSLTFPLLRLPSGSGHRLWGHRAINNWLWANYLSYVSFSFHISKIDIIVVLTSQIEGQIIFSITSTMAFVHIFFFFFLHQLLSCALHWA